MSTLSVLLIEKKGVTRDALSTLLQGHHFRVLSSEPGELATLVSKYRPALLVIGPATSGTHNIDEIVLRIRCDARNAPIILVAQSSSEKLAVEALRAGVNGYVRYPFRGEDVILEIQRCLAKCDTLSGSGAREPAEMVGGSQSMQTIRRYLCRSALTDSNVLITGETGTGKELAAEFVHRNSPRNNRPFVTVNCAAIPDGLLESELFGFERGAFTGAHASQEGKLRAATGGTIFLDEIGDMSPYAQAKILRVTESKEIQRLGTAAATPVNVRMVAATNQDLEALVREGRFRKDLFFRLNVGRAHLPPLRERKEDIPALVEHYLQAMNVQVGGQTRTFSEDAWLCMLNYEWPGNVRELKNFLETICIHAPDAEIRANEIPRYMREHDDQLGSELGEERKRLLLALSATDWNKSRAAEKLHWSRMTLYRKIAKHQVSKSIAEHSV
jgi:DNA-binding NtrC family response regulator